METAEMPGASATGEVVDAFFAAVGEGDRDRALGLVADRVDWGGAGDPSIPWIGERTTRAEVGEFLDLLAENLSTQAFDILERIVEGENAAVICRVRQTVTRTGKTFEGRIVFHIRTSGGKIVRYRYYEDSLALARAYGSIEAA